MEFFLVLAAVMGAFYFILLRPVISQQRRHRDDISNLAIGDEVLTTGGFYATVKEINTFEDRPMEIVLEAAPGVHLRGTTGAVSSVARRRLADEEPDVDEEDDLDDEFEDDDWDDDDLGDEDLDEVALDDEEWDEDEDWDDDDWEDEDDDEESRLQLARPRSS